MGCAAQEVGLAGMLSILTAVLLDTTGLSHVSAAEPDFAALPTNFSSVAKAVVRYCSSNTWQPWLLYGHLDLDWPYMLHLLYRADTPVAYLMHVTPAKCLSLTSVRHTSPVHPCAVVYIQLCLIPSANPWWL